MDRDPESLPFPSRSERWVEWTLFLLILLLSLHASWTGNAEDRYEFLRRGGDALGYYQWLPAVIIDHEVDRMFWTFDMGDGRWLSLFNIGVAALLLPFFLVGHAVAAMLGEPMTGFSWPYMAGVLCGSSFYLALGCVFSYRLARTQASVLASFISAVLMFAATNLFFYGVYEPLMSHLHSFFLIALFGWCSVRMTSAVRGAVVMTWIISASFIVLVRPLNIVIFIFPLLLWLRSKAGLRGVITGLLHHRAWVLWGILVALLPWLLQSAYWHHITGSWLLFTYGEKGESFDLIKMVPGMVLVAPRNGWFTYTPLMIPVMVALLIGLWRGLQGYAALLILFIIVWLLYAAWWCWWLGGAFGYRGFIDIYGLLVLPMTFMIAALLKSRVWVRAIGTLFLLACIKLNIGLSERYEYRWSTEEWQWTGLWQQVQAVLTDKG